MQQQITDKGTLRKMLPVHCLGLNQRQLISVHSMLNHCQSAINKSCDDRQPFGAFVICRCNHMMTLHATNRSGKLAIEMKIDFRARLIRLLLLDLD